MFNRFALLFLSTCLLGSAAVARDAAPDKAMAIHKKVLTLDSHVDILTPGTAARYFPPDGRSAAELPD